MASNVPLKPPKKRRGPEHLQNMIRKPAIDLRDWIDYTVLGRFGSGNLVYRPGKILSAPNSASVNVLFDKQKEPVTYTNVLETSDILGNHSPAARMLHEGLTVCVREKPDDNVFVVAKIRKVDIGPPLKFLVESEALPSPILIPRANIRLMQPPWHDDLAEAGGNSNNASNSTVSTITIYAQLYRPILTSNQLDWSYQHDINNCCHRIERMSRHSLKYVVPKVSVCYPLFT